MLLGVTLDSALTMDRHVTGVVRSCNYHIRALRHITHSTPITDHCAIQQFLGAISRSLSAHTAEFDVVLDASGAEDNDDATTTTSSSNRRNKT